MDPLTFYFDRNIGKRLPEALTHLQTPFAVKWHNGEKFPDKMPDDEWMEIVGKKNWVILSQDYKFHMEAFEHFAVKQHGLRCFYLPGTGAKTWTTACALVRAHKRMIELCEIEAAPFIFDLKTSGRLIKVKL